MRARLVQTRFNAGEISERVRGRTDLEAYFAGARALKNMLVLIEGGVIRRSGTEMIAEAADHDVNGRLIPFIKSNADAVMIEAGHSIFRFLNAATGALLEDEDGVITINTGYGETTLPDIYSWQSADVMFFTSLNGNRRPQSLRRYADDDWELGQYELKLGPFLPQNTANITIAASGTAPDTTVTLTANAEIIVEDPGGHLASRWRLWESPGAPPYKRWTAEEGEADGDSPVSTGALREFNGRVYRAASDGVTGNQPPVHETGTVSDGSVNWEFLHDGAGVVRITSVDGPREARGVVEERLPTTAATKYWAEGSFSGYRGWPRLGGIYEERQIFMSSLYQPDTLFASRSGEYDPVSVIMKPGAGSGEVLDNDGITRTLADGQVNPPAWMIATDQIIIGTPTQILRVTGPSIDEPITPAGAVARQFAKQGSAIDVRAVATDYTIVYAAPGGRRAIELSNDGKTRNLNALAEHVGASPFAEFAWAGEPHNRLFARRKDGALFCLTYDLEQGVTGWCQLVLGGAYQGGPALVDSIAVIPGPDGEDRLWLIVRRTIGGETRRFIERLRPDWRGDRHFPDDAVFMDSSAGFSNWNADPAKTLTLTDDGTRLEAAGHAPFDAGAVGKVIRLRNAHRPPRPGDAPGDFAARVDSVDAGGAGADVTLVSAAADGHADTPLDQWAWTAREISGLDHLEGETVRVQADGGDLGEHVVSGGAVDLGTDAAAAYAGLAAPWLMRSVEVETRSPYGTTRGAPLRIEKVYAGVTETGEGQLRVISDERAGPSEVMAFRRAEDLIGAVTPPYSGIVEIPVETNRGRIVQVEAFGAGAMPVTINFVSMEVAVDD